jgi:hypothetical protein
MNFSKIMFSAFVVIAALMSCKKDHDEIKKTTIEGRWEGAYINDASGNSFYYSFNIKPGGIIEEINASGEKIGEGTWEIDSNNIFSAKYKWIPPIWHSTYTVIGALYHETGKLLGNWGYGSSATNGGTWEMQKSN